MAFLIIRYRARASSPEPEDAPKLGKIPQARGHAKTVIVSVALSSIILGVLIFGTLTVTDQITSIPAECKQNPSPCLTIQVTAFRFGWNFSYPNGKTLQGNLTIPVGRIVILRVASADVFHSFGIDDYKIKKDAIPGRPNQIWFVANEQTSHIIRCFELCGVGHAGMTAKVTVVGSCSSTGC